MSQYDMMIVYIPGENNTVADALSHIPAGAFPGNGVDNITLGINATLTITVDPSVLCSIQDGYSKDDFCQKFITTAPTTLSVSTSNGLWYIGDRLLIPCMGTLREDLFCLAHDTTGHFGVDKCYATLHDTYYWPNMQQDLEKAYIPSCTNCLRNKSAT